MERYNTVMVLTFGSLFSGIGGLDLGFERAGMACVWQVEVDPFCRRVLAKHWPNVPRHDDVRTFKPVGEEWWVDVVCGGFPCKQTSVAAAVNGTRTGLAGPDSGLWYEMLRVVRLVRPNYVVTENVSGAGAYAEEIEGGLAGAGYRLLREPLRLSAEAVGAPHRRRRFFWVAYLAEPRLPRARPEGGHRARPPAPRPPAAGAWLPALGGVLRVADGVPGGVDRVKRIRALGNAVVPAVAELVGRYVVHLDAKRRGRY